MTNSIRYEKAMPEQFGDMHERMKFLIQEAQKANEKVPQTVWHAIWDLEAEVKNHAAIRPPFGKRTNRVLG